MRTLQEKYNGVLEGNYSKAQFKRDAAIEMPQFVSNVNSFDDAVAILKNKGAITEAKTQAPKYSTAKPADRIAPDVLDTAIKFELDKKYGTLDVTPEQFEKCKEMAIKNLSKDVTYYVKQDSVQLETPGEKMEKANLNEGIIRNIKAGIKQYQHDRLINRYKKNALPAKTAEELSTTEIQKRIDAEFGPESDLGNTVLDARNKTISLKNATKEQVQQLVDIAQEMKDSEDKENDLNFLATLPNFEDSMVKEITSEEISKEDAKAKAKAWKEYQEKRHVTDKTIAAAEKDFNKGWKEGKYRDGDYMAEAVDTDELRVKVANILKGQLTSLNKAGGDAIIEDYLETQIDAYLNGDINIEEPMEVVNDFRYYMDENPRAAADFNSSLSPNDSTPESPKKDDEESLEEGHGENPKKYKDSDTFDPTKFYIKDLKSGRILNAVSVQGSKLISYYDTEADAQAQADWITRWEGHPGRFVVLSGDEAEDQVNKQTGVEEGEKQAYDDGVTQDSIDMAMTQAGMKEQQLKELFKKIITKIITE